MQIDFITQITPLIIVLAAAHTLIYLKFATNKKISQCVNAVSLYFILTMVVSIYWIITRITEGFNLIHLTYILIIIATFAKHIIFSRQVFGRLRAESNWKVSMALSTVLIILWFVIWF